MGCLMCAANMVNMLPQLKLQLFFTAALADGLDRAAPEPQETAGGG